MNKKKFHNERLNICLIDSTSDLDEAEFEIKQFEAINLIPVAVPKHFIHNKGLDIGGIEKITERIIVVWSTWYWKDHDRKGNCISDGSDIF